MAWETPKRVEELQQAHQRSMRRWLEGSAYSWTIENKFDGEFIGRMGIRHDNGARWSLGFWIHPEQQFQGYGTECARAALSIGFDRLQAQCIQAGYVEGNTPSQRIIEKLCLLPVRENPCRFMKNGECIATREFEVCRDSWQAVREQSNERRLAALHHALHMGTDYQARSGLLRQLEAEVVVPVGKDVFGREQYMLAAAADPWRAMQAAADADGVEIQLVSAFRSVDYQQQIIERKLAKGEKIQDILTVNAAPGFSEHHTGCAIDLASTECEHLSEAFERTAAFAWLQAHAADYGFYLSYPRDNPNAIIYEPWHWAWRSK